MLTRYASLGWAYYVNQAKESLAGLDRLGRLGEAVRHVLEQRRLQKERDEARQAIVILNADLERRIAERTVELQAAN